MAERKYQSTYFEAILCIGLVGLFPFELSPAVLYKISKWRYSLRSGHRMTLSSFIEGIHICHKHQWSNLFNWILLISIWSNNIHCRTINFPQFNDFLGVVVRQFCVFCKCVFVIVKPARRTNIHRGLMKTVSRGETAGTGAAAGADYAASNLFCCSRSLAHRYARHTAPPGRPLKQPVCL